MKILTFPEGHNGWRPKPLQNIEIKKIGVVNRNSINESGFVFNTYKGIISDEDATYLKLTGKFKIREIPEAVINNMTPLGPL